MERAGNLHCLTGNSPTTHLGKFSKFLLQRAVCLFEDSVFKSNAFLSCCIIIKFKAALLFTRLC